MTSIPVVASARAYFSAVGSHLARGGRLFLLPIALTALGGCAIRPVQEDATRIATKDIVQQIRCEARLAVLDKAIALLTSYNGDRPGRLADIIADLTAQRGQPLVFDYRTLRDPGLIAFYKRYIETAIAYEFTFNVKEENKAIAAADPIRLITNGTVGIGLDASNELERNNIRRFVISETFSELLTKPKLKCLPNTTPPNFIYPISGSVGLAEVIHTFIDLNEAEELETSTIEGSARRFGDSLQFTTKFSGGVSPHVILTASGRRWGLAAPPASLDVSATRTDTHKLIVGLSMDPKKTAQPVSRPGFLGSPAQPPKVSRGPGSNERRALEIIEDQRLKDFLDRGAITVPR